MSDCPSIDPLITPYVDGDIGAAERRRVDAHVRVCPPCHSRVAAEQAIRDLLHARRGTLSADSASVVGTHCATMAFEPRLLRRLCIFSGAPSGFFRAAE